MLASLFIVLAGSAFAQSQADEDYHIYRDSPRLLLSQQRVRLLRRERDRKSMRWEQFQALISGRAPLAEPGFAWALDYQVAGDPAAGRKAVDFALGDAADLRQLALVFDWCGPLMSQAQADRLAAKIEKALGAAPPPVEDARAHSARTLAAIAIAGRLPDHGEGELRAEIEAWWQGAMLKRIHNGQAAIPREQIYWFYEMLHAVRDNLNIDLRESATAYFTALPIDHLTGHYPSPYQAAENEYRIPVYVRDGAPDLNAAIMSRAAEMAMVAFDDNALYSQYLQGWLMQDRFLMRGGLGVVYEFLWANPYQPGLSYFQVPLVFHDASTGHVFARTSWDDDATWIGYFDGHLQMFTDGRVETLRPGVKTKPVHIGGALLLSAENPDAARFHVDAEAVFVMNLAPRAWYDVEVDDEELQELETDVGGTLVLSLPEGFDAGVRIRRRIDSLEFR